MSLEANPTLALAKQAKSASRVLVGLDAGQRNAILEQMARAIEDASDHLLAVAEQDLLRAQQRTGADALPASTLARLELTRPRLLEMADGIRSVAALPDPLHRVLEAIELDSSDPEASGARPDGEPRGLHLQKVSVPLGLLAVIFEARPDAVTQIASLAIKSGNAVMLKPGSEVEQTAAALVTVLQGALVQHGLPATLITLVTGREQTRELLQAHQFVDLVIPRGSRALVDYVQSNTRIPVLGHAEGICHIYVDQDYDPELALRIVTDAKLDYPAACNAVETVLVHKSIASEFIPRLASHLASSRVHIHGDEAVRAFVPAAEPVANWHTEWGSPDLSVAVVDNIEAAIAHIHTHGSQHTESILTENLQTAEFFLREVDAAGVYHNVSTRFADGFRYGFGAEVGISTSKIHARGPVGLLGLTTYKWLLRGKGHIASDYRSSGTRKFTHRIETVGSPGA